MVVGGDGRPAFELMQRLAFKCVHDCCPCITSPNADVMDGGGELVSGENYTTPHSPLFLLHALNRSDRSTRMHVDRVYRRFLFFSAVSPGCISLPWDGEYSIGFMSAIDGVRAQVY